MYNILESVFLSKELYQSILAPVCTKYRITQAEMAVLLFISSNPAMNTAADIDKARSITKSAVSMAVRSLQEKGYLSGEFMAGNHRSVYLNVCDKAADIVNEGMNAQNVFLSILTEGLSENEISAFRNIQLTVLENIRTYRSSNM